MAWEGMRLVAIGLVIGAVGGTVVTRLLTFALYGMSPLDIMTWSAAVLLMFIAGLVATLVPSRRATRVNPIIAIQAE